MQFSKLSIVIPAYNEGPTIELLLNKVKEAALIGDIQKEIIVVNDGSNDDTHNQIEDFISKNLKTCIKYLKNEVNVGKGASISRAIKKATGDLLIIQDADLEYDPAEYNILLKPVLDGKADVVYGSRSSGGNAHRNLLFWHQMGNNFLTFLSNLFTDLNITDMETCYKLFKTELIQKLSLREKRFGFEPEVTAKISRIPDVRIYEVGISYYGRTFKEGKKIGWKDGLRAVYCIIKYNIFQKN